MEGLFEKIISREIPAEIIYENEKNLAFLDITPRSKGHTLVISKTVAANIIDLDADSVASLFLAVKKTTEKLEKALHPVGFTIGINHGEKAGQAIDYLHVHIIPRYENDGGGNIHSIVESSSDLSLEEVRKLLEKTN